MRKIWELCASRRVSGREDSTAARRAISTLSAVLLAAMLEQAGPAAAQNATWAGPGAEWTTDGNWSPTTAPTGIATFTNNGAPTVVTISNSTSIGEITFNAGAPSYSFTVAAGQSFLINGAGITNNDSSVPGFTNNGVISLGNSAVAGNASFFNTVSGMMSFQNASNAGQSTLTNSGNITFFTTSSAGSSTITNDIGGQLQFTGASTAGSAVITNSSGAFLNVTAIATAANATISNFGTGVVLFDGDGSGGNARIINNASTGSVDFSAGAGPNGNYQQLAGSIEGSGNFYLGANRFTVGGNNLSTTVSGVISDCGSGGTACQQFTNTGVSPTGGSLFKVGTGTLTLSGTNTYTGATFIDSGTLQVDGSIATSSLTHVNVGGTLQGVGLVGNTLVSDGSVFSPGNGTANSSMRVIGNLTFTSNSLYMVQIDPTTASFANVTGTAAPGGAAVNATYANGSYVSKQYTILTATGGVSGTFSSLVNTNLPANFTSSLNYDATHAYLDLALNFTPPPSSPANPTLPSFSGLNINQQNVANALTGFFNTNGGIPMVFGGLTPVGLTQVSGEIATGSQQATFNAMGLFMGVMTDPYAPGHTTAPASPGVSQFADDGRPAGATREAYAGIYGKAPAADNFEQRWSVWAASYGGSQTTNGDATLGSNTATSQVYGVVAGADFRLSPFTTAGFALAGGSTGFSVANGGTGRSDLFQAGAFIKHVVGPVYVSAALAYGWQDITTDRTVTAAGIDRLRAEFNANAWSGRLEGGYRFVTPWLGGFGVTPYAAAQFTTFDLPAYAESVVSGSNNFALAYGARSVTDTRSELGIRTDKSYALTDAILTLRGRTAWAHDYDPDRSIGAVFQTLPGASFVVNGAAQASDSLLSSWSAEVRWLNGFSVAANFESEYSSVTRSYSGKGVFRYTW